MSGPLKCELEKWLHSTLKIPVLQGGEDVKDPCMPALAGGHSGDCASRTRFAAEAAKPCSSRFGATGRPWRLSVVAGREPGFEAGYRQTDALSRRHVQTRKG